MVTTKKLQKQGELYIVATPIGNLGDISLRAVDVLKQVDLIAAEDTRHSLPLLRHFAIHTPMLSLHNFNERAVSEKILQKILNGESVALISDAGTPLISDPGFQLVSMAHEREIKVIPIPGPTALISALSVSGLPANRFIFEGFLEAKQNKRQQQLNALKDEARTLIFYESPHRILQFLQDMLAVFGPERHVVLARELTKHFETIRGAPLSELVKWVMADTHQQKGEFVILVHGVDKQPQVETSVKLQDVLQVLMQELPLKQAVSLTSHITGERKNVVYQMALDKKE